MGEREALAGRTGRAAPQSRSGAWLRPLLIFAALVVVLWWYVPRWYAQQFAR